MTSSNLIAELLRKIPPQVRFVMLSVFAVSVVGLQLTEIWLDVPGEVYQAQTIVGGYLGIQSAANVITKPKRGQDYAGA